MLHWVQTPKSLDFQYLQRLMEVFQLEIGQLKIVSTFKNLTNLSKYVVVLAIFALRFLFAHRSADARQCEVSCSQCFQTVTVSVIIFSTK